MPRARLFIRPSGALEHLGDLAGATDRLEAVVADPDDPELRLPLEHPDHRLVALLEDVERDELGREGDEAGAGTGGSRAGSGHGSSLLSAARRYRGVPPAIVWFRRDLRVHDHPPLGRAAARVRPRRAGVRAGPALLRGRFPSPARRVHARPPAELATRCATGEARWCFAQGDRRGAPRRLETGADARLLANDVSPYARARDRRVTEALRGGRAAPRTRALRRRRRRAYGGAGVGVLARSTALGAARPPEVHRARPSRIHAWPAVGRLPSALRIGGGTTPSPRARRAARGRGPLARGPVDATASARTGWQAGPPCSPRICTWAASRRASGRQRAWRTAPRRVPPPARLARLLRPCAAEPPRQRAPRAHKRLRRSLGRDQERWRPGRRAGPAFPLVDAGMRQCRTRLHAQPARLVVGSFLTKDLHLDWRQGEAHFMRLLLYGEGRNNGNWQWVAASGRPGAVLPPDVQPRAPPAALRPRRRVREALGPGAERVPLEPLAEPWTMSEDEQAASLRHRPRLPRAGRGPARERRRAMERYRRHPPLRFSR